jgi:hypothetical protein
MILPAPKVSLTEIARKAVVVLTLAKNAFTTTLRCCGLWAVEELLSGLKYVHGHKASAQV